MPEVKLEIGGRNFVVACQPGEEPQLTQAASLLDVEAQTLQDSIGRVPESRMLLMAGLMLADRTAEIAEQAHASAQQVEQLDTKLRQVETKASELTARALQVSESANEDELEEAKAAAAAAYEALEDATAKIEALAGELAEG